MITIDTTIMKELVGIASAANSAIDAAVDALNRVSIHNDWGCREKTAINEYCITNKRKVKNLQENASQFLTSITKAANDFEGLEGALGKLMGNLDGVISKAITIMPNNYDVGKVAEKVLAQPPMMTNPGMDIISSLPDLSAMTWFDSHKWPVPNIGSAIAASIGEPIPICRMTDFDM